MESSYRNELDLTIAICNYLRKSGYLFYCDIAAGLKLSTYQSILVSRLRCGRGLPDIVVFYRDDKYVGYCFEVKKDKGKYLTKNGNYRSDKHIQEQIEVMNRLREQGWFCSFVTSVDEVKEILKNKK